MIGAIVIYWNGSFYFVTTDESLIAYTPVLSGDDNKLSSVESNARTTKTT